MNTALRKFFGRFFIFLFLVFIAAGRVTAQSATDQSTNDQIAALQLQLTNAWHQVETIVNQPMPAYRRDDSYHMAIYPYWFHPGASTPDFNTVDVRQSQQLIYTATWVSSDITPTMMFHGSDLEFNAMTKLFYTNRSLPKKKLTEAEMVQINALYRTIGHCQAAIAQLQPPPATTATDNATDSDTAAADTDNGTNGVAPATAMATLERIPKKTRMLYGGIAIGALLVFVIALRLLKKKPE